MTDRQPSILRTPRTREGFGDGRLPRSLVPLLFFAVACGGGSTAPAGKGTTPAASHEWTRAEWLRAVEGFVADPATMPRLSDPATAPTFRKLVTSAAWVNLDHRTFETDLDELVRFFPAKKGMTVVLMSRAAIDELLELGLYALDFYAAFIAAGTAYIAGLPENDASREDRMSGIDKVRLGAAIEVCALLYLAVDASAERRASALRRLSDRVRLGYHSRESLQLILATLDERILPWVRADLKGPYGPVRDVVAREHAARVEKPWTTRRTYQGMGPPRLDPKQAPTTVSTTGGFSMAVGPGALASRVEVRQPDGSTMVRHEIQSQAGETTFESVCFDTRSESDLTRAFESLGTFVPAESAHPGKWFTARLPEREGRIRILTIGGRGCIASAEGPPGQLPIAAVEAVLLSIRAAP